MMIPGQNLAQPNAVINPNPGGAVQNNPPVIKQPSPNVSNIANNIISTNIGRTSGQTPMDLFNKKISHLTGKKDKAPKVGIIDIPPYDKTPVESELKRLKLQKDETKEKTKKSRNTNPSGALMFGAIIIGGILFLLQIREPMSSLLSKIPHK